MSGKKGSCFHCYIDVLEAVEREQYGEKVVVGTFETRFEKILQWKPDPIGLPRSGNCEARFILRMTIRHRHDHAGGI